MQPCLAGSTLLNRDTINRILLSAAAVMEPSPMEGYRHARQALDLSLAAGWPEGVIRARISIGRCYWLTHNYTDAAQWYKSALGLAQSAQLKELEARCYYWISTCYVPGALPPVGTENEAYYKHKSIGLLSWIVDAHFRLTLITETGGLYYNQGAYAKAVDSWKQAMAEAEQHHLPWLLRTMCVNNLAGGYLAMGRTDSAGRCLFDFLAAAPWCLDSGMYAPSLNTTLADYYKAVGKPAQAIAALQHGISAERSNGNDPGFMATQLTAIAALFAKARQYDSAFRYMQRAQDNSNIALQAARSSTVANDLIKATFKSDAANYQSDIDAARAASTAANRRLAASLCGLVIIAALAIVLYRSDARNRRKNKVISEQAQTVQAQKGLIQQSLAEKEVLLREIHHRVKNNLQQINGLLNLQLSSIQEPVVQRALTASSARVGTIALIHQQLYQNEDLVAIDMHVFCSQLFDHISQLYDSDIPVRFVSGTAGVRLNPDTAVPLSLILNELLTNSFKYAFEQVAAPEARLSIKESSPGQYLLTYKDNGPGLPPGTDYAGGATLGMLLMTSLTRQLRGSFEYDFNQRQFIISFINAGP